MVLSRGTTPRRNAFLATNFAFVVEWTPVAAVARDAVEQLMVTSLVCAASLFLSSTGIALPASAPVSTTHLTDRHVSSAQVEMSTEDATSFLTAEERALLAANPMMLQVGGDDSEEMWSAYAAVGIACVLAIGLLFALGA